MGNLLGIYRREDGKEILWINKCWYGECGNIILINFQYWTTGFSYKYPTNNYLYSRLYSFVG